MQNLYLKSYREFVTREGMSARQLEYQTSNPLPFLLAVTATVLTLKTLSSTLVTANTQILTFLVPSVPICKIAMPLSEHDHHTHCKINYLVSSVQTPPELFCTM